MIRLTLAACGAAFLLTGEAAAETMCGPLAGLVEMLTGPKYAESLMADLAQDDKSVVQVYSNPETQSWTILALQRGGIACLLAAGKGLEIGKPYVPGQGT